MAKFDFWVIKPTRGEPGLPSLSSQAYHDEMFLSPHVRLGGFGSMAHIESERLAKEFSDACTPILQNRYGPDFALGVVSASSSERNVGKRIEKDSDIVRKRLETANFAPNKPPK